jgi:hypothetical protein
MNLLTFILIFESLLTQQMQHLKKGLSFTQFTPKKGNG